MAKELPIIVARYMPELPSSFRLLASLFNFVISSRIFLYSGFIAGRRAEKGKNLSPIFVEAIKKVHKKFTSFEINKTAKEPREREEISGFYVHPLPLMRRARERMIEKF